MHSRIGGAHADLGGAGSRRARKTHNKIAAETTILKIVQLKGIRFNISSMHDDY